MMFYAIDFSLVNQIEKKHFLHWLKMQGFKGNESEFLSYRFVWFDLKKKAFITPHPWLENRYQPRSLVSCDALTLIINQLFRIGNYQ